MCGIAGFIQLGDKSLFDLSSIQPMVDALTHRGPDGSGVWGDSTVGIALGHRRLAILDLSAAGQQPMISSCGRYVIVFNGEIYNHMELRREMERISSHYSWRGHSDTETLLAAFSSWGIDTTLSKSKGMFAIALWDRLDRVLTLARDRLGEKPLYYGWQQGRSFLFGSELHALKANVNFRPEINLDSLQLFLTHNCVPAPYSIYKDIYKLEPGTYVQLSASNPTISGLFVKKFWSIADVAVRNQSNYFMGTADEAISILDSKLQTAVCGQMLSDVPVGAMLSGGIDSSLITALMQANSSSPVKTFTIGFDKSSHDESAYARSVARHLGTEHTELKLSGLDALSLVPMLPSVFDEPFADSSQLPTYLVMQLARQHVKVALSGDGGDELFGGYNGRYVEAPKKLRSMSRMPFPLRYLLGQVLGALQHERLSALAYRLRYVQSFDDLWLSLNMQGRDGLDLVRGANFLPSMFTDVNQWPRINDPIARVMTLDAMTYLPDDILVKVDRSAMAVSLETREPFLDKDVVEFACALPMSFKIRGDKGKWILRQVLDRYVPRKLIDRPKMGFSVPLDDWLRGPLREWAEQLLSESRLIQEGFFDAKRVRDRWRRFLVNRLPIGDQLWAILMFQAWLDSQKER